MPIAYYGDRMEVVEKSALVTVSPKYQVVIPEFARRDLEIKKGQKMMVMARRRQLLFIPVGPITELRGSLGKMDLSDLRDHSERF